MLAFFARIVSLTDLNSCLWRRLQLNWECVASRLEMDYVCLCRRIIECNIWLSLCMDFTTFVRVVIMLVSSKKTMLYELCISLCPSKWGHFLLSYLFGHCLNKFEIYLGSSVESFIICAKAQWEKCCKNDCSHMFQNTQHSFSLKRMIWRSLFFPRGTHPTVLSSFLRSMFWSRVCFLCNNCSCAENLNSAVCSHWRSHGRASWAKCTGLKSNFCKPCSFTGEEGLHHLLIFVYIIYKFAYWFTFSSYCMYFGKHLQSQYLCCKLVITHWSWE